MKLLLSKVCLAFGILLLLMAGSALTQEYYGLKVEVPFAFTAGNSHFEGGHFFVKEAGNDSGVLLMSSQEGRGGTFLFASGLLSNRESASKPRLVFHQYGDHYFLSQIWFGGGEAGCELKRTKAEEETAHSATAMNLKPIIIEIAAR